jgi:hypothetical protein
VCVVGMQNDAAKELQAATKAADAATR